MVAWMGCEREVECESRSEEENEGHNSQEEENLVEDVNSRFARRT